MRLNLVCCRWIWSVAVVLGGIRWAQLEKILIHVGIGGYVPIKCAAVVERLLRRALAADNTAGEQSEIRFLHVDFRSAKELECPTCTWPKDFHHPEDIHTPAEPHMSLRIGRVCGEVCDVHNASSEDVVT
jgi:hypothetical protein